MDFSLTESQELIKKEVGALARTFSLDYWLDKDNRAEYPHEFVRAFADNGWLGIMVPEAYGGSGLGVTEAALMLHEICASGAGTSGASPMIKLLSGVKLSGPLTNLANLQAASAGMRCFPLANGTENFSQSGSNN